MQAEERVGTESIFQGRIIKVRVDSVTLSGGRESTREVVEHEPAVVVTPIDADGKVLLVRQYRYAVGRSLLEAPAGIIEAPESPRECAQRELQEEVGYRAKYMRPLGGFWTSPGFCDEYMYAFLAKDLVPSRLAPDDDEDISVERYSMSDISKLIRVGEIEDSKTISVLLMVAYLFGDE